MNDLMRSASAFDWEQPDPVHFFEDFIQKAVQENLLSSNQWESIQLQILRLLSERVKKFTNGESSSVPAETAEQLAQGIFYTIGQYLKNQRSTEAMRKLVAEETISELFSKGQELLEKEVESAKFKLQEAKKTALSVDNIAYNDSVNSGLNDFFFSYNYKFFPQDTSAAIDYPLCLDKMDTVGIEYIRSYIDRFLLENAFCSLFDRRDIRELLGHYDGNNGNAVQYLFNIFSVVLKNSLASVLLKRDPLRLEVRKRDCENLQVLLGAVNRTQLQELLTQAENQMIKEMNITDTALRQYLREAVSELSAGLHASVRQHTLPVYFVVWQGRKASPLTFVDRTPMKDAAFRELTEEIRACSRMEDKLALTANAVRSFEDFVGILEGDCFFGREYEELYVGLGDWELALLLSRLSACSGNLADEIQSTDWDKEWQTEFVRFLGTLDGSKLSGLAEAAKSFHRQWE